MVKRIVQTRKGVKSVTIPVFVDSVKKGMTRLNFLVINYHDEQIDWHRDLDKMNVPYILIGPFCVVCNSIDKKNKFQSIAAIKDFFGIIKNTDFLIETNHIWLPNFLLNEDTERGDCYRIRQDLFIQGHQFAANKISEKEFLGFCKDKEKLVKFEKQEADAFRSWGEEKVAEIRRKRSELFDRSKKEFYKSYLRDKKEYRKVR